jgi:hypothetical protein
MNAPRCRFPCRARRALPALRVAAWLAALSALCACAPKLTVGEWTCAENGVETEIPDKTEPIAVPWSTGFETRFCDYTQLAGFCYTEPLASYTIVSSPVHSGSHAAAFRVQSDKMDGNQARCVRQGGLPSDAYYGVWYFLPQSASNAAVWNLVHFQGGTPAGPHGLWDVSLVNGKDGQLEAVVYDFLSGAVYRPARPVPINAWFHLEFHLKRAADASGEVALYQDGELLFEEKNLITDDSSWGQWYVGNFATGLTPPDLTLYVDDVTIRATR